MSAYRAAASYGTVAAQLQAPELAEQFEPLLTRAVAGLDSQRAAGSFEGMQSWIMAIGRLLHGHVELPAAARAALCCFPSEKTRFSAPGCNIAALAAVQSLLSMLPGVAQHASSDAVTASDLQQLQWQACSALLIVGDHVVQCACLAGLPEDAIHDFVRFTLAAAASVAVAPAPDGAQFARQTFCMLTVIELLRQLDHEDAAAKWPSDSALVLGTALDCTARWLQRDPQLLATPFPADCVPQMRSGNRPTRVVLTTAGSAAFHAASLLTSAAVRCQKQSRAAENGACVLLTACLCFLTCPLPLFFSVEALQSITSAADGLRSAALQSFDDASGVAMQLASDILIASHRDEQVPALPVMQAICQLPRALMQGSIFCQHIGTRLLELHPEATIALDSTCKQTLVPLERAAFFFFFIAHIGHDAVWHSVVAQSDAVSALLDGFCGVLTAFKRPNKQLHLKAAAVFQKLCSICAVLAKCAVASQAGPLTMLLPASVWQNRIAELPPWLRRNVPQAVATRCCTALAEVEQASAKPGSYIA